MCDAVVAMATGMIPEFKLVSSVYLQLSGFVLGKLAGLLVGWVGLGPAVLGAVPVDVRCKRVTLVCFCGT